MKKILLVGIILIGLVGCNDDVDKGLVAERKGNYQDAEKLYSKSCNSDNGDACFYLAEMYLYGKGVKQNTSKATDLYIKGCNERGGKACYHIGDLYVDGRDLFEAVRYYQKACDFKDWSGCYMLSSFYELGGGGLRKDESKAKEYIEKACDFGMDKIKKDQCK